MCAGLRDDKVIVASYGHYEMSCAVATTTWNSVDIIALFLDHYRKLGFGQVFVMDFDSTDGTQDILKSSGLRDFVTVVPFPGLASLDSSNRLLAIARSAHDAPGFLLFCDPDEFLVTPTMHVGSVGIDPHDSAVASIAIPRFNVTAPLSIAQRHESRLSPLDALTLRITRGHRRTPERDVNAETLEPPWIFTAIPGKTMVRPSAAVAIGPGDHNAHITSGGETPASPGVSLLHYPFRGFQAFEDKIALARLDFYANPQLPPWHGWQLRRWVRFADAGRLRDEYLQQFVPDVDVAQLVLDGTLEADLGVVTLHRQRPSRKDQ